MNTSKGTSLRKKAAVLIGGITLSISAFALPASADGSFITYHGENTVRSEGTNYGVQVCDNEIDGHIAYAYVELVNGLYTKVHDNNNNCTTKGFSLQIKRMKACETNYGNPSCTGWVNMN